LKNLVYILKKTHTTPNKKTQHKNKIPQHSSIFWNLD